MSSGDRQHDVGRHDGGTGAGGTGAGGMGDPWEACAAGELTQMVRRLDASQRHARRKQVYTTALLSTGVFACVVLAVGSLVGPARNLYGGISCRYCRSHFAEYQPYVAGEGDLAGEGVAGRKADHDADFVGSMKTHLEKCTFCRAKFNAMYPDQRIAGTVMTRPLAVTIAVQPMFAIGHRVADHW